MPLFDSKMARQLARGRNEKLALGRLLTSCQTDIMG